jgi:exodeoxyribonuclease III
MLSRGEALTIEQNCVPSCGCAQKNLFLFFAMKCLLLIAAILLLCSNGAQCLRVASFNIMDGVRNDDDRLRRIGRFVADQRIDLIGLNELNGWTEQLLGERALAWGHTHVAFMRTNLQGSHYNLGVTSRLPMDIVELRSQGFWHGLIHVAVNVSSNKVNRNPRVVSSSLDDDRLHLLLTHLNPHSAEQRIDEVAQLVDIAQRHDRLMLLGDLNTLSRLDREHYDRARLEATLARDTHLAQKYLLANGSIDYRHIDMLSSVMSDLDYRTADIEGLRDYFSPSVPTPFNSDAMHAAPMRLDYVFVRPLFNRTVRSCGIIHSTVTDWLSDHYPIVADFS